MSSSVACSMVDVIMGGTSGYSSYWSMSAGPEVAHFPVMTTGGPADDSTWLEISDFEYDYITVRQNIASMNVGGAYAVSLAWSMSTNTSSDAASCILAVSVDSTTILETGASASGVRAVTGSWKTATAAYTPTASTGIPFVITVSCSEGQSSDSPIIGLADISMISSSCTTSTSIMASSTSSTATTTSEVSWTTTSTTSNAVSTTASSSFSSGGNWIVTDSLSTLESGSNSEASTATTTATTTAGISSTSDGANWITTDALSTLDAASTAPSSSTSSTASSTTSSTVTASTGTTVSDDDGTTTLTASTTDGDSLSASVSVDSDDSTSAVSGTVSVTNTTASKRKRAESPSCTLYISQDSEVISTTVVDAGSHAAFAACLAADSLESVELLAICSGSGATIEVSNLTVGSDSSAAEECEASASATSSSFASASATPPHRSISSKSPIYTPVSTRSTRPSLSAFASYSQSAVRTSTGSASPSDFGSGEYTSSTLFSTRTSTNTASPSAVTDFPAREKTTHVTKDTVAMSTIICSAPEATATTTSVPTGIAAGSPYVTTETVLKTRISTIYKCPATVTNCPAGEKTTETTTETFVAGTTVYTVSSASSSSSSSSSSGSGSENTIKAIFPTTDTVSSYTVIPTGTVTETVAIDSTSSADFSGSKNTDYVSTLRSSTHTANAAGSINTLVNTSTSSPNSAATEGEASISTLPSIIESPTSGAAGAGSDLSTTAGVTVAAGAAGTTSETSSLRATSPSGMRVSSSSLPSSFTVVASGVGGVHASLPSTSSSLTTTAGTTAITAPVLNGALSPFSPSLTWIIGLVIAFFM